MRRRVPKADDLSRRPAPPIQVQSLGRARTKRDLLHQLDESHYTECRNDGDFSAACFRLQ